MLSGGAWGCGHRRPVTFSELRTEKTLDWMGWLNFIWGTLTASEAPIIAGSRRQHVSWRSCRKPSKEAVQGYCTTGTRPFCWPGGGGTYLGKPVANSVRNL